MTTKAPAHIVGSNFVTVMIGTKIQTIRPDSHPQYNTIREAVKKRDWAAVEKLMSVKESIETFAKGHVKIENGELYYQGEVLHNGIVTRIMSMMNEGFDAAPLITFLENLMQNPSKAAVEELYEFLEQNSLPITEDGHFLAYKKVRDDYLDFYTGKVSHKIGDKPEMPRNRVDDNRHRTCSYGLHFCSMEYLPSYHGGAGRVVIVKINPRDVVSIPTDYNYSKGRACTYEVVAEHTADERTEAFTAAVYTSDAKAPAPVAVATAVSAPDLTGKSDAYCRGFSNGYDHYKETGEINYEDQVEAETAVWDDPVIQHPDQVAHAQGKVAGHSDRTNGLPYGSTVTGQAVQHNPSEYWKGYSEGWAQS